MDYIREMKKGREIVIVSNDENYDSAIFWMDREGSFMLFAKEIGICRKAADQKENLRKHFEEMEKECRIFVRGCPYDER